jgi:hypothetical protein
MRAEKSISPLRTISDSGGYFTHHWIAAPLTVKGKKVRLKGSKESAQSTIDDRRDSLRL